MSSTSEPLPGLAVAGDRGRRDARVISIVAVAHFVSHVHIMLLPPILLLVKDHFGASYSEIALAITAYNVASALLQTPAGFLVDRIGARLMLTLGLVLSGASLCIATLLPGYWFFLIGYTLLGVANTVYHPADYSILSAAMLLDHFGMAEEAKRVREAVNWTLQHGFVTKDIDPVNFYFTSTIGELVCDHVAQKIPSDVNQANIELRKSTII